MLSHIQNLLLALVLCFATASASGAEVVRIMAANTTSGNFQSYDPAESRRIFQGLDPDIVLIQEFNFGDDSPSDIREMVDITFGTEFYYYREAGNEQIPNGIISRYPIIQSGEWQDNSASNRDFAWAQIDIPGDKHLWAVSVHLLTTDSSRPAEAVALVNYIQSQVPAGDYILVGGDFNADVFSESALNTLSAVVTTDGRPNDQNGNTSTNAGRSKPYDQILPGAALKALETSVIITGHGPTYSDGLVFDSRVFTPLSAVSPVLSGDSGATNMQHMAVVRDFLIPDSNATEPSAYPTNFVGSSDESSIDLTWTDVAISPVPDGYLIKASTNPAITAPTDGIDETPDSNLADGTAQIIVSSGAEMASFTGLPFDTTYHFRIFPFTDDAAIDYKTDGSPPSLELTTLSDSSLIPAAPVIGPFYYVHGTGFTVTWDKVAIASGYRIDISESATFSGGGGAVLIDENFDASSSVPAGWVNDGTANDTLGSHYSSASNCRALSSGDELETPAVDFPSQLSFYVDSSGGGNGNSGTVSYSIGAGAWQSLGSFTVDTGGAVETFDLTTGPDLSTDTGVRFRFESSFNTWYLDDVLVNGSSGSAFVTGYENLAVSDVDRLPTNSLDPDTDYYIRIRAENANGTSPDSNISMVTTRSSGTPYESWASDNEIPAADPDDDADNDSLSNFGEFAFNTNPTQSGSDAEWLQLDRGNGIIDVTHRRSLAPGITWSYLGSTDLDDFSPATVQTLSVTRAGNHDEVVVRINTGSAERYFIRIEATLD